MTYENSGKRPDPRTAAERFPAVWVGAATGTEMQFALRWAGQQLRVEQIECVVEAGRFEKDCDPAWVFLPLDWSGALREQDLVFLARRWPLALLVVVIGSCVDGCRRRGPNVPGAVAVPWYELPGRLSSWITQRKQGVSAALAAPATSRREERLLNRLVARHSRYSLLDATVASVSRSSLASLDLLAAASGIRVVERHQGLPPFETQGDVILWDVVETTDAALCHLARLHAARPTRPVLLLDSFPRGATLLAVLEAGGSHLLGRPVETDVFSETIRWCWQPARDDLGRP